MKYRKLIRPELRPIARKIPYHRLLIGCANLFQEISLSLTAVPKEVAHRSVTLPGYRGLPFSADIFEPQNRSGKLPCLLYIHGGAFSYKASAYHKRLACIYAKEAACRVYFPDYHLLPRYPYPAAYEDVLALYRYVTERSEDLEIDCQRIGVAGDSAGAALAALLCNSYERQGLVRPCLQVLIYPVTDIAIQTASMKRFLDTPLWNAKNNWRMWAYYSRNAKPEDMYGASPMHSSLPRSIPDTYIETAEYDCLHDEGVLYGKKLQEAGAHVVLNETTGTMHGYDFLLDSQIAQENVEKRLAFLRADFMAILPGSAANKTIDIGEKVHYNRVELDMEYPHGEDAFPPLCRETAAGESRLKEKAGRSQEARRACAAAAKSGSVFPALEEKRGRVPVGTLQIGWYRGTAPSHRGQGCFYFWAGGRSMETLILNGSPREQGDTASLVRTLQGFLHGKTAVVHACTCGVSPCTDCRFCWEHPGCALQDGWQEIDGILRRCSGVVIATPIWFSQPTGPLLSLLSRLQQYYCGKAFRGESYPLAGKRGGLILVGGGDGSMAPAEETCRALLRHMGCGKALYPAVKAHHTNTVPALSEPGITEKLRGLAAFLEGGGP